MCMQSKFDAAIFESPALLADCPLVCEFMTEDIADKVMAVIGTNAMAMQSESINNIKRYIKANQDLLVYINDKIKAVFKGVKDGN